MRSASVRRLFCVLAFVLVAGGLVGLGVDPVVTPLEWPGEPIPAKVLMIGLKDGRWLGYAVADLNERELRVYSGGHISSPVGSNGGTVTARGDVLVEGGRGGYLVPGGDFTKTTIPVRPSRYVPERRGIAPSMGFVTDPSGSLVWMWQNINMHGLWPDGSGGTRNRIKEKWIDLFNLDTREIVMTADIRGDWGVAGALHGGLLLRERHSRLFKVNRHTIDSTVLEEPGRIMILTPDGSRHYVTPDLDATPHLNAPVEGWRQGFRISKAYGNHFALFREDTGEMFAVDAETGTTYPVPKPGAGVWRSTGIPSINIESYSWPNSDVFVTGFRAATDGRSPHVWSLYEIRLSDQSVRELYSRYESRSAITAKSVAGGTAVLAFTGWPVSPDNNAAIEVVDSSGELIPLAAVPDDFFILDAR